MNEGSVIGESIGRIEVAPEVIATIAYYATLNVPGVSKTAVPPSGLFRRAAVRHEGVVLTYEEQRLIFNIYVWLKADVNMMETSRGIQQAVFEAMDNMVGVPVEAVHVHVENITLDSPATAA